MDSDKREAFDSSTIAESGERTGSELPISVLAWRKFVLTEKMDLAYG